MTKTFVFNDVKTKDEAIWQVIDWQKFVNEASLSYGELATAQDYFKIVGKRFGLLREFKENGII